MNKTVSTRAAAAFVLILSIVLLLTGFTLFRSETKRQADGRDLRHTLVLDPGHGGLDGGAVSDDGTKESDLNLAIAEKTRLIAEFLGQETVMTREDGSARTDFSSYSEHADLVRRTELINGTPGAIAISIHQNDFPTGQPSGAQVLYSGHEGSKRLGCLTHDNLVRLLDPENRRLAEPAPKGLYITAHAECPTILVECGFMSNNFEVQKLCDPKYQNSIALVLVASLIQYLNSAEIT